MRLIDADELLKKAYHAFPSIRDIFSVVDVIDIINAQTVDAEPIRHAHWTKINYIEGRCSSCLNVNVINWGKSGAPLFCEYCGAKMDELANE